MSLFASNKKWKQLKLQLECYKVKLDIVDGSYAAGSTRTVDNLDHVFYAMEQISTGFGVQRRGLGVSTVVDTVSYHEAFRQVERCGVDNVMVLVRFGSLEMWHPLAEVADCIPAKVKPTLNEAVVMSGAEAIASLIGLGLSAWAKRSNR
ncbi:hypothetical protein D3C81_1484070 [compost metagenome]